MVNLQFPSRFATFKLHSTIALFLLAGCIACSSSEAAQSSFQLPIPQSAASEELRMFELNNPQELDELTTLLLKKRALFVGEIHDRPIHHENQLRIIQSLYARHADLVIGVEYFQQPFQRYLDDFLAGRIDEKHMLLKTEYYKRWQMDYRMLQPILEFAKQKHIPILALNISEDIHSKVFNGGMQSLSAEEKAQIPYELRPPGDDYRQRLKAIFDSHPQGSSFENFVEGQVLWDEAMADTASRYLLAHPQSRMVILAGLGHMMYGDGIPKLVNMRLGSDQSSIVINGDDFGQYPGIADFLLSTAGGKPLPKPGMLGVSIANGLNGVRIESLLPNSAAQAVGLQAGDDIVMLDDVRVTNVWDLKTQMFDKQPGQRVRVEVRRENEHNATQTLRFEAALR